MVFIYTLYSQLNAICVWNCSLFPLTGNYYFVHYICFVALSLSIKMKYRDCPNWEIGGALLAWNVVVGLFFLPFSVFRYSGASLPLNQELSSIFTLLVTFLLQYHIKGCKYIYFIANIKIFSKWYARKHHFSDNLRRSNIFLSNISIMLWIRER